MVQAHPCIPASLTSREPVASSSSLPWPQRKLSQLLPARSKPLDHRHRGPIPYQSHLFCVLLLWLWVRCVGIGTALRRRLSYKNAEGRAPSFSVSCLRRTKVRAGVGVRPGTTPTIKACFPRVCAQLGDGRVNAPLETPFPHPPSSSYKEALERNARLALAYEK